MRLQRENSPPNTPAAAPVAKGQMQTRLGFANLLRQSRVVSIAAELHPPAAPVYGQRPFQIYPTRQVITAPKQHTCRNDWGIKSNLPPLKSAFVSIGNFDSREHQPQFDVANDKVLFLRRAREMGIALDASDPSTSVRNLPFICYQNPRQFSTANVGPWLKNLPKKALDSYCRKIMSRRREYFEHRRQNRINLSSVDPPREFLFPGVPASYQITPVSSESVDKASAYNSNAPKPDLQVAGIQRRNHEVLDFLRIPQSQPRQIHATAGLSYAGAGILPTTKIDGRMIISMGFESFVALGGVIAIGYALPRSNSIQRYSISKSFIDAIGRLVIHVFQPSHMPQKNKNIYRPNCSLTSADFSGEENNRRTVSPPSPPKQKDLTPETDKKTLAHLIDILDHSPFSDKIK